MRAHEKNPVLCPLLSLREQADDYAVCIGAMCGWYHPDYGCCSVVLAGAAAGMMYEEA